MQIIECETYDEMSEMAAQIIIQKVQVIPNTVLGLATGSTPIGLYEKLVQDHIYNGTSYRDVTTFNLDEYIGLCQTHTQSYYTYMNRNLFGKIDIPMEQTHIPKGDTPDHFQEAQTYEERIQRAGGIDLQVLGIGKNGHIGFNEPGTSFSSRTHVVDLTLSTREANQLFFDSIEEVPTKAISMGVATIMESKEILLLISGAAKTEAYHRLIHGEIDEQFPASILKKHPNVTILVEKRCQSAKQF